MEGEEQVVSKYLQIVRGNLAFFGFLGMGILFLLVGIFLLWKERVRPPEITIETDIASSSAAIKVDVEGAVIKAGVYELTSQSRVQDGLVAAGGLSATADRDYVSKNINLAAKMSDGAKIYIPKRGETVTVAAGSSTGGQSASSSININTANEAELDKLWGVGAATAQKIIAGRPYKDVGELVSKKAVSQSVFDKIKGMVTAY